jgi:isochorismate hydrolase
MSNGNQAAQDSVSPYADPANPALPETGFKLDRSKAALVVVDPQNDFLSPSGASWSLFGESITENNTVAHLG